MPNRPLSLPFFLLIVIKVPVEWVSGIGTKEVEEIPCLEVNTIIFRSRPTPKTLLKA